MPRPGTPDLCDMLGTTGATPRGEMLGDLVARGESAGEKEGDIADWAAIIS